MNRFPRFDAALAGRAACCLLLALAGCERTVQPVQPEVQVVPPAVEPAPPPAEVEPAAVAEPVVEPLAPPAPAVPLFAPGAVRGALLLPLSGPQAALGEAMLNAAELALFDHAGKDFVLLPLDTAGTATGAERAMREALAEGADVVLGPLLADSVRAAAPAARAAGVPVIAFTNDRGVAGNGVYVLGSTPAQQVERVVGHARAQGLGRFAALVPDNDYGNAVVSGLYEAAARNAVAVDQVEFFPPGQAGVGESVPVRRLVAAAGLDAGGVPTRYDALLIAAGAPSLRALAPLFPYYDLDPGKVQFLGTRLWKDPAVLGEPALINGWFAAPPDEAFRVFEARYRRTFGAAPPRLAALAYDAVALASVLGRDPARADFHRSMLIDANGFVGVEGVFRFRDDGVAERGLAVYRVAPRSFEVLDPAPTTFAVPVF
jgi:ABC-type branched-subunit amino acid transport system substrate-binding protein